MAISTVQQTLSQQTEPSLRSVRKNEADVADLRKHARYVIEITDSDNVRLISNTACVSGDKLIAPLIVVVAQIHHSTRPFWASVAEIGYERARPYRRVHINKNQLLLQHRYSSWQLGAEQLQLVYPYLLQCLESVLSETRLKWKSTEPWFINGKLYEKGVQITINQTDALMCQALLRESIRFFRVGVFSQFVKWINWKLRYSQFEVYQVGRYGSNVREVIDQVRHSDLAQNPFWFEVLLQHIPKRRLLENALFQLHNFASGTNTEFELAFNRPAVDLPVAKGLFLWHTADQPANKKGSHADNCSRFEVVYDRKNPHSRQEQRRCPEMSVARKEIPDADNDCPF